MHDVFYIIYHDIMIIIDLDYHLILGLDVISTLSPSPSRPPLMSHCVHVSMLILIVRKLVAQSESSSRKGEQEVEV